MAGQRGFSLVELLFALVILAIVITTSLAVFVERTRRSRLASDTVLAYQALANESEVVRRVRYSDLDGLSDDFQTDLAILAPLKPFATEVEVDLHKPGVKRVILRIRWKERQASVMLLRSDTGGTNLW